MNTRECRTVSRHLSLLLDGRVTLSEETEVRDHLAACGSCRGKWEELQELRRALAAIPTPALPHDALHRLHSALPAKRAQAAWVPAVCGVALLMAAAAIVQQQLADPDEVAGPGLPDGVALWNPLEGVTARAQVRRRSALEAMTGLPAAAEAKAAETPTGGKRHGERPARRAGKQSASPRPVAESGSYIVVAVSRPAIVRETGPTETLTGPGSEISGMRLKGEDGQPEAELIVGRMIGQGMRVQRIMIAYRPIGGEELGARTPQSSEPSEESTDEPKRGDVLSEGDEDRDACSHPRLGRPSACLRASEA